jgi:hypothetical protein
VGYLIAAGNRGNTIEVDSCHVTGSDCIIWMRLQQQRDMWDTLHIDKSAFKDVEPYHRAA